MLQWIKNKLNGSSQENKISPGGSSLIQHNQPLPSSFPKSAGKYLDEIDAHIAEKIGEPAFVLHELISDKVHLDVHVIKPTEEHDFYTLVTSGMSDKPMNVPEGYTNLALAELMIFLPKDWLIDEPGSNTKYSSDEKNWWPIRMLKACARLPHDFNTWVGYGHTIPNGNPIKQYAENTKQNCALITYPYLLNHSVAQLKLQDGNLINFYNAFPIYQEEVDLKLEKGTEELESLIEEKGIGFMVDPLRENACK